MENLAQMHCHSITANTPQLSQSEINELLKNLPGWKVFETDGEPRLEKTFKLENFDQALALTNQVAQAAIQEDHHPAILTEWGKVTITWWTHRIKGLHLNDFIMAAQTEQLFEKSR
jgi:4a-hydroxytetrahydrobiopterin dehydratase